MAMQIPSDSLFATHPLRVAKQQKAERAEQNSGFVDLLNQGIGKVNGMQNDAHQKIEQLLAGDDVNSAEVYTSVQKADMSFRMLVQIRNKLMKAFDELNNIRV